MQINVKAMLNDPINFPWELIDMDRPYLGQAHSYLCEIMGRFDNYPNRPFYKQKPTLKELIRFQKSTESAMASRIITYCELIYSMSRSDRANVATEVLDFLINADEFVADFEAKLLRMHREGSITINSKYFQHEQKKNHEW